MWGGIVTVDAEQVQKKLILQGQFPESKRSVKQPGIQFAPLEIGQVKAICIKSTPCYILEQAPGLSTLALSFAGDRFRCKTEKHFAEELGLAKLP